MGVCMFIGRKRELATLRRLYKTESFQLPVIYGRRRVGKTSLIAHFTAALPTIFFTAIEDSTQANLRNLSREYFLFEHPDADPAGAPVFPDFQTAFESIFTLARQRRIVLVIDEYPYLAKAEPSVSSILQMLIDRNKDASRLFMILCGSSLSFMREQVLSEKSPLYGRRTAQLEIKPLDFFESLDFFPEANSIDAACYYGMVGGIPLYLKQFDPTLTLSENIEAAFLDPSSLLFEEPTNLVKQEVKKAATYNAVIGAIADGKTTSNEIATTVGSTSAEINYPLKELQRIGLVERELPFGDKRRRGVYRLSDNLFAFWYRFILPSKSLVERGLSTRVLGRIEEHLPEYMGPVFEQICREWLWRQNAANALPFEFDNANRWWGSNPATHAQEEIDIVCAEQSHVTAVCECKWRNQAMEASVLKTLDRRAPLVNAGSEAYLCVFAKTGFTEGCKELTRQNDKYKLITFEDMLQSVAS